MSDIGPTSSTVTDEQLLHRHCQGDPHAFATLMERHQRELFNFLFRFLGERSSAEDVFQETFLQVHESSRDFDQTRNFRPWLFTIAANKARDLLRKKYRRSAERQFADAPQADDVEPINLVEALSEMPEVPLERKELQKQVQDVVATMPEHLREVLLLAYFNEFSYRQVADIVHVPVGTVKSRLHAAVAHFAKTWKAKASGPP